MPRKLRYTIVGATGEAEGYPAKNLEEHSPTVAGWQTPRFCIYPQEVIVQLKEPCKMKKLQILAHQYLIPSKVEFYVGGAGGSQSFKRLGYINLSGNEKTGYKSRELKSVHVDTEGTMLKLVLHKNHLNKLNLYNQVSIMALNIIGDSRSDLNSKQISAGGFGNDSPRKNPDYISPMDDLAFDLYQDPEVAQIIRRLDARKSECVKEENFDGAKKMKQAIADLKKVGEKLAKYELEKRKAIEEENYDIAKMKKTQMEEYRLKVYQQLRNFGLVDEAGIHNYLEMEKPSTEDQQPAYQSTFDDEVNYPRRRNRVATNLHDEEESEIATPVPIEPTTTAPVAEDVEQQPNDSTNDVVSPRDPTPQPTPTPADVLVAYDEKVIPALNNMSPKPDVPSPPPVESRPKDRSPQPEVPPGQGPEPMSEKAIREASSAIEIFGLSLVSGAYSKTYSYREEALLELHRQLKEIPADTNKDDLKSYLRAAVFIVKRGLVRDNVFSVFNTALNILDYLLTQYIPQHHLGRVDLTYTINQTLPKLILKTGESQVRARQKALEFIEKMSTYSNVKATQLVPQAAVQPFPKEMATRLAEGRVEIVSRLLKAIGLDAPALSSKAAMSFCMPALEHIAGSVRDATSQLIYQIYRLDRETVKNYLPPDEPSTRRNLLYRNIFDQLDRIDGKPTQAELKAQREREAKEAEKKKQAEIQELQAQVQFLRQNNAKMSQPQEKTQGKQNEQESVSPQAQPDNFDQEDPLDRLCIFCGERDEGFDEEGLDLHYWRNCPMLKRCEHCKQVVEISTYNEHLLSECDKKSEFGKCSRCNEAIPANQLQKHVASKKCEVNKADKQAKCPMCHKNIPLGEESWKSHLTGQGKDACLENPRRLQYISRMKAKAQPRNQKPKKATNKR